MKPRTSPHPALQRRQMEQQHLLDVARRYARRLAEVVRVDFAVVAGSVARGDFHDGSDIDVLIVSDALPEHPLRRAELLFAVVEGGVEPKGLSFQELARELERQNPLVLEALERGVIVYPEGAGIEELRRRVEAARLSGQVPPRSAARTGRPEGNEASDRTNGPRTATEAASAARAPGA